MIQKGKGARHVAVTHSEVVVARAAVIWVVVIGTHHHQSSSGLFACGCTKTNQLLCFCASGRCQQTTYYIGIQDGHKAKGLVVLGAACAGYDDDKIRSVGEGQNEEKQQYASLATRCDEQH